MFSEIEKKTCNASIIKETDYRYRIIIRFEYNDMELIGSSPLHCIGKAYLELKKQGKLLGEVSGCTEIDIDFSSKTSIQCRYFGRTECVSDTPCVVYREHGVCIHE